jgi:hypothetical protein
VTSTIAYDKPVANYIDRITATGHVTNVAYKKTSVTIHHNGGKLSLDGIYQVWRVRRASAHFQVDSAGNVGQYVKVNEYAWAVGNTYGNQHSISIEQANSTNSPKWQVGETTWKSAARLAAWLHWKVLGTRPVKGKTLFRHHDWSGANTECAGPFIDAMWDAFVRECQAQYDAFTKATPPNTLIGKVRAFQTLLEVTSDGKWGDLTDDRAQRMRFASQLHTYAGRGSFDIRDVQRVIDADVDGVWGPKSQAKLEQWIPQAQRILGVNADGVWGPDTDSAFWALRKQAYNKF